MTTYRISLTHGQFAEVDLADLERVGEVGWRAKKDRFGKWFARRKAGDKYVSLHRLVVQAPKGHYVVPQDGNYLNCTRANLKVTLVGAHLERNYRPKSGERHIVLLQHGGYRVQFSSAEYVGVYRTLTEAIAARDGYIAAGRPKRRKTQPVADQEQL